MAWLDDPIVPISLDSALYSLAVEREVAVADMARPGIDHVGDPVGCNGVVGAERDRVAPVVIDVRATSEAEAEHEQRRERARGRFNF
jgi:hypothetical protein